MKFLIIIVEEDLLQDVLTGMVEVGITGATILNSVGMGRALAFDVPIFAGFKMEIGDEKRYNKTIFAVIENETVVDELVNILKEIDIDFDKPQTGIMFTVPIDRVVGNENG